MERVARFRLTYQRTLQPMPNLLDQLGMAWFLALGVGAPLFGWALMVGDYRAYLRSLRRAIAIVRQHCYRQAMPGWVLHDRPPCLEELGLVAPCTREEVLAAYRQRVKQVHPDHGGDRRQFDRLQGYLGEALELASEV